MLTGKQERRVRIQVPVLQSRPGRPTSPWIALLALAALLLAIRVADAQTLVQQTLVSNLSTPEENPFTLGAEDIAQGFRTGANPDGYTLASIDVVFAHAPTNQTAKLLTGLPTAPAEVATLNNPPSLIAGTNEFTAPVNTLLSPNTTYFVSFQESAGSVSLSTQVFEDPGKATGWTVADELYLKSGGTWSASSAVLRIRVNGYIRLDTPTISPPTPPPIPPASQSPDPANFARGPVQWLGQGQDQVENESQSSTHALPAGLNQISDEPRASTHAFPVGLNEISANKPRNPSGSLDLAPIPVSLSQDLRQPSRGLYLTTTVDRPRDAPWLFQRTPDGGYALVDAQSRRYPLALGAPLLKLSLWHIYHHLGRGLNSVQLLGGSTINDRDNRLTQPLQLCLPAPDNSGDSAERARIAVRGRYDRHWTILETTLTEDGRICAAADRIAWLVIVLQPPEDTAA